MRLTAWVVLLSPPCAFSFPLQLKEVVTMLRWYTVLHTLTSEYRQHGSIATAIDHAHLEEEDGS